MCTEREGFAMVATREIRVGSVQRSFLVMTINEVYLRLRADRKSVV